MRLSLESVAAILLILVADSAYACRGCESLSPANALERADLVFFGRVSEFYRGAGLRPHGQQYWEFEVEGLWKGPPQPRIRIYAFDFDGRQSSCDMSFHVGTRYLVYAYLKEQSPNRFRVHLCSRTTIGESSLKDLSFLGQPPHRFSQ